MKTIKKIKLTSLLMAIFMLHGLNTYAQAHATMGLKNIQSTANTIEYDLYILNDGTTNLKLSACSFGINYNDKILNGGNPSYQVINGTRAEGLKGLNEYVVKSTQNEKNAHLRMIMAPSKYEASPQLNPNELYKIGRFQISNSSNWTPNSSAAFSLQEILNIGLTTTQLIAYAGNDRGLTNLSVKNKTLKVEVENSPVLNPSITSGATSSQAIPSENTIAKLSNHFKLYPNPTSNKLNVEFKAESAADIHLKIYSIDGKLHKHILTKTSQGFNNLEVDLSELGNGLYTIQIQNEKLQLLSSEVVTKR